MQGWSWYCSTENKTTKQKTNEICKRRNQRCCYRCSQLLYPQMCYSQYNTWSPWPNPMSPSRNAQDLVYDWQWETVSLSYAFCISSITRWKDLLYWWQGNLENMVPFKGFIRVGFPLNINNSKILTSCFTSYCVDLSFSASFSSAF